MHNQFKTQKFKHLMLAMGPRDLNSAPYSPVHCSSHSMTSFQSSELTELPVVKNSQLFAQRVHSARYAPSDWGFDALNTVRQLFPSLSLPDPDVSLKSRLWSPQKQMVASDISDEFSTDPSSTRMPLTSPCAFTALSKHKMGVEPLFFLLFLG